MTLSADKYRIDTVSRHRCAAVHTTSTDEILTQTNAALCHFVAAMLLYPDVQAKAQAELDAVVGRDRLPDYSDRVNLPYVNSVILETLRWKIILPMGTVTRGILRR
jgi:hypothetical protein